MLSLPIKLTRDQTRLLKKENLVCVGVGNFIKYLFGGDRLKCHYIDLGEKKASLVADEKRGNCHIYLYFLHRNEAARIELPERSDLIVPYVAKPRAPKPFYCRAKNDSLGWTVKGVGNIQSVYDKDGTFARHTGSSGQTYNDMARSSISNGTYVALTRSEFLSRIKACGLNEDGTKIAPPAPVPRFKMENLGQVWKIGDLHCMICQTARDTFRAIGVERGRLNDLGNRFSENDTIPEGARMVAPTLADFFKNKLDS